MEINKPSQPKRLLIPLSLSAEEALAAAKGFLRTRKDMTLIQMFKPKKDETKEEFLRRIEESYQEEGDSPDTSLEDKKQSSTK